jgi:hypothetical protein
VSAHAAWYLMWLAWALLFGAEMAVLERPGLRRLSDALEAAGEVVYAVITLWAFLHHWWAAASLNAAVMAFIAWRDWRRRKRKRGTASLGAKSRALRAALVRRMRESGKPRPALQPAPRAA